MLDSTAVLHGEDDDGIAPVAHLKVLQAHLEEKREEEVGMGEEMKEGLRSVFERRGVEVDVGIPRFFRSCRIGRWKG